MHSFSSRFLIVFLLLISSVPVYASSSIYGRLDLAVSSDNKANGTITDVRSHASRVGIKGSQIFDNGMAVIYQYELQVEIPMSIPQQVVQSKLAKWSSLTLVQT